MNKLSKGLSYLKLQKGKLHGNRLSSSGDVLAMQSQYSVLSTGKGFFILFSFGKAVFLFVV